MATAGLWSADTRDVWHIRHNPPFRKDLSIIYPGLVTINSLWYNGNSMTIEELQTRLDAQLKALPGSGFDTVADSALAELETTIGDADNLGMKSGKKLISNLAEALKTRKSGGNTDESVQVRLVALDFYLKNLQSGTTEDL